MRGWACLALLPALACQTDQPLQVAVVRDSAGVQIVEHGDVQTGLDVWSLAPTPEAMVGHLADEDPAHQFTQIRNAIRMSDGRIVIGDWGTKEARYFDRTGRHLLTVGGGGAGPGEIRFLYYVDRVRGDTLVVDGWPIGSRYWFDENGDFVLHQAMGPWFPGMLGRTLPDGSFLLDTFEFGSYGNTLERWAASGPDEDIRPEGVVELVSADGTSVDTLATIRGEWYHKTGVIGQDFMMHALPFTPLGLAAWSAEEVYLAHTEEAEIHAYALDGSLVRIVRWESPVVDVTGADREGFEQEVLGSVRRPGLEPVYRRWLSEATYPETMPVFKAMISDEDGNLWMRPSGSVESPDVTWTVFDPDGTATATVSIPTHFRVLDVDATHVIVTWKDELDVELVASYSIAR